MAVTAGDVMGEFKKLVLVLGFLATFFVMWAAPHKALAATLSVPSQYGSIQAAINAASNGDTILVSPGTYREFITINDKYITVKATSSDPTQTIIAGPGGQTGVMIQNVPYRPGVPRAELENFEIVSNNNVPDGQGGGITIANNADPIINNNLIESNHANDGGGILVYNYSNPLITNNHITGNDATSFGGGIFVVKYSSPTIYGNAIDNNDACCTSIPNGGSDGGGIYLENDTSNSSAISYPVIVNNTIQNNSSDFAGGGIAVRTGVDADIENNTIDSNHSAYGGGVHPETAGSASTLANNTITNNQAAYKANLGSGTGHGGGISVYDNSKPYIYENTVENNDSSQGGAGVVLAEGSNSSLIGNDIVGNVVQLNGPNNNVSSGGGIYIASATANVTNNIINHNSGYQGGGIGILDFSTINVTNNTIVRNTDLENGIGGGIFVVGGGNPVAANIINNILALNSSYQVYEGSLNRSQFINNLFRPDGSGEYDNAQGSPLNTAANINSSGEVNATGSVDGNPVFASGTPGDSPTDYIIGATSAAKDQGTTQGSPPNDDYRNAIRPTGSTYDIGAYEYTTETTFKTPVYRFWSDEAQGHFYTLDINERNNILGTFPVQNERYEGVGSGFDAYAADNTGSCSAVASTIPIYRLYRTSDQAHTYLVAGSERNTALANGWTDEGVAFCAYPVGSNLQSVYRFISKANSKHFFTANHAEKSYVENSLSNEWQYEEVVFEVPKL